MPISTYYKQIREKVGSKLIFMPSVAAIIKNEQGEILFQYPGGEYWSLPAGAIELGETPEEAVIREVWEETGLQVQIKEIKGVFGGKDFRHTYENEDQVEYIVVVFECEVIEGELKAIDGESLKLQYFSAHKRPKLALPYPEELFL
ncbi:MULTISPECIES: NUDIX domain-containing protein [Bacillus cereus group]|uniref:NUDIX domain-containing protein n=1 Tax=Bacillus cereus group TaxID=86661 RepID=UPI000BF3B03D|nr:MULTISPECIES: NUDIX domain-containing protein [Bacillus cereus group]PFA22765.1 NUDIX hydrolase [Bacillus cereus]PFO79771.1 NUDIX hydrolase [Bacillus cereus]PGZ14093.1 NUDIX hydrolase [Bacillus cereus]